MSKHWWSKEHGRYWDSIAQGYDGLYASAWSRWEDDQTETWLRQFLVTDTGRLLDLGCGTGLGYELVMRCRPHLHYCGLDLSENMLAQLRAKFPRVECYQGSMTELEHLPAKSFDYVIALNAAFSFAEAPKRSLQLIERLLKPQGRVFLSALNRWSLRRLMRLRFTRLEAFGTRQARKAYGAVPATTYGHDELATVVARSGFLVRTIYAQGFLAGVFEYDALVFVEQRLSRAFPRLCHTFNVVGEKRG